LLTYIYATLSHPPLIPRKYPQLRPANAIYIIFKKKCRKTDNGFACTSTARLSEFTQTPSKKKEQEEKKSPRKKVLPPEPLTSLSPSETLSL
jgi:hypothetical protein